MSPGQKGALHTVISGTFQIGMGDAADKSKVTALPAGGFFGFPPGMTHFAFIDEDTVVQINSNGPKDDPRQKTQ